MPATVLCVVKLGLNIIQVNGMQIKRASYEELHCCCLSKSTMTRTITHCLVPLSSCRIAAVSVRNMIMSALPPQDSCCASAVDACSLHSCDRASDAVP